MKLSTACPLDCPDGCTLEVSVDVPPAGEARIAAVDADRSSAANPFTQGFICAKVKRHAARVHSPERVLTPLVRTGAKGSGTFRTATWDEAASLIAGEIGTAIDRWGVDSVVAYLYSSSGGVLAEKGLTPLLFERLGCPEVVHTICASTSAAAWKQVFGNMLGADPADLDTAQLIVVWGANPTVSNTHLTPAISRAVAAHGARLVVVDPRRTGVAGRAHLHLAIRPGTDVILAFATARRLVERGLHDADFLARHVEGADEFLSAADAWTLERAALECGITSDEIESFVSLVGAGGPAMLRMGWGLERNRNGGSGWLGALSMWAVAGHFASRGSGVLTSTAGAAPLDADRLWPVGVPRPPRRQLSMNDVGLALHGREVGDTPHRSAERWPVTRVLFVQGANPVATAMDQATVIRGLEREDLFTVVHDQVLTDTARYADVVLPATTHFEAGDLANSYGSFSLQRVEPVIGRVGKSRSNDEVAAVLAAALDLPEHEFDPDPARLAAAIRTDGRSTSLPRIREPGTCVQFIDTFPGHADGSRRARLHDPSSELPLPQYAPRASEPDGAGDLVMLTPATNRTINSMFADTDPPDVVVSIHPDDARARGDGTRVRVFNGLGEIRLEARFDGSVRRGVVSIPKGLWRRSFDGGSSTNVLIPRGISDLAAGACFNDARVDVEPC